jgi:hypothetical protein
VELGLHQLKIRMPGFRTFLYESFPVEANRTVTINAILEAGGIEQIVEVTATAETTLTKDAPLRGGSLSGSELIRLPFAYGERFWAASHPGVILPANSYTFTMDWGFSVNGQRPRGNNFMLDGTDNNDIAFGGTAQTFNILDAIQESSVQTGNFGVEFGRAGGGVFNIITRSGTNQFHGTLNWRLLSQAFNSMDNQTKLNAKPGEKPKKPVFTENIYGFTIGGPIVKDRTFFFGGFQQDTFRQTANIYPKIPTEEAVTKLRAVFPDNPRLDFYLNEMGDIRGYANPRDFNLGRDPTTGVERGTVQFAESSFSLPRGTDRPQWIIAWITTCRKSNAYHFATPTPLFLLPLPPSHSRDITVRSKSATRIFYSPTILR